MRDIFKNSKAKLVILIFVFSFGFTAPFYISSGAGAIAYITKEFGLDLIARGIARKLLTDLGNQVIQQANTLGDGGKFDTASFVTNWKRFLANSQVIGENQFRAQLNYSIQRGVLCNDLKGPLALAFQAGNVPFVNIGDPDKNAELKQNTLTTFQTKMRCTIPDQTREEFKKDFTKGGGWETWSRMLEPQNNLSGATLLSIEELQKQRASQENARQTEIVAGQGFKGVKDGCQGEGAATQCAFLGQTVTPANILGEVAAKSLTSNFDWLTNVDELSEIIVSMVSTIVKKTTSFSKDKGLIIDEQDNVPAQIAPDFSNDAQQDRQNFEEIKENTEEFDVNVTVEAPAQSVEPTPTPTPNTLEP